MARLAPGRCGQDCPDHPTIDDLSAHRRVVEKFTYPGPAFGGSREIDIRPVVIGSDSVNEDLRLRIARLDLPLPLEGLVYRALRAQSADHRHERLTIAFEATCRVIGSTLWAACRALSLRSPELDQVRGQMTRPSFGHWIAMIRATRALLAGRKEGVALALAPLLEGLQRPFAESTGVAALAEAIKAIPGKSISLGGRTVFDVVQQMPAYRNAVQSTHREVQAGLRATNAPIVLEGLLALWETVPPVGGCKVAVIDALTRDDGWHVELASMHGAAALGSSRSLSREVWEALMKGQPYLVASAELFVPLYPLAAATAGADGWTLGWLEGKVHSPTLQYEPGIAEGFRVTLAPDEYKDLLSGGGEETALVREELLALEPWRGLLAYDEAHAPLYFGREEEIEETLSRLSRDGCVVLCGASGSGKSSLMRAGVIPRLRERAVRDGTVLSALVITPGAHPIDTLRRVLIDALGSTDPSRVATWSKTVHDSLPDRECRPDALVHLLRGLSTEGRRVVLAIDQLEEAVTQCHDEAERNAFLDVLARASSDASVVATVRADLFGELFAHEGIRDVVQKRMLALGALEPARLARIVTEPLRGRRVVLEPGLEEIIVRDVGREPGALALLSQVLTTLWEERGRYGDRLTRQGYEAAGRVAGALQKQADAALAEVDDRTLFDRVLLQLAHVGDDAAITRRRVHVTGLAEVLELSAARVREIVAPFLARRLLVLGSEFAEDGPDTIEVAHEALLTSWRHAGDLVRQQSEAIVLRREISAAARAWMAAQRRGELWSDGTSQLRRAEELLASGRIDLARAEREFLRESRASARRRRVLERAAGVALGVLAIAALGAGAMARKARDDAQRNLEATKSAERAEHAAKLKAEDAALAAIGAQAAALSRQSGSELEALTTALVAVTPRLASGTTLPPKLAEGLYAATTAAARGPQRGHSRGIRAIAFSPDGTRIGTASWDHSIRLWDGKSGRLFATLLGHTGAARALAFAPDGSKLVSAGADGSARVWDAWSGTLIGTLTTSDPQTVVNAAHLAHDGRVLTAADDKQATLWVAGTAVQTWSHDGGVLAATFNSDETLVYTASRDGTARVFSPASKGALATFQHGADVYTVVASPKDPKRFATSCKDRKVRVIASDKTMAEAIVSPVHGGDVEDVAWSPDGKWLATASDDRLVRIVDATTGKVVHTLGSTTELPDLGHSEVVFAVAWSPSGEQVASASQDGTVRLWNAKSGARIAVLRGHEDQVVAITFSPDGTRLASAGYDRAARLWDVAETNLLARLSGRVGPRPFGAPHGSPMPSFGEIPTLVGHSAAITGLAFSRDGTRIATTSRDHTAGIWDSKTGALRAVLRSGTAGTARPLNAVAFSTTAGGPDRLVTVGDDGLPVVWDAVTGARLATLTGGGRDALNAVAWSPDGGTIAVAGDDRAVTVWDVKSPNAPKKHLVLGDDALRSLAFDRTGATLAVGDVRGALTVIDTQKWTTTRLADAHKGWVNGVAFDATGGVLTTASDDRIALWDARTLKPQRSIPTVGWASAIVWDPAGRFLATADEESVRLLSGTESIGTIEGAGSTVALSPDGTRLAAAGSDGVARVFPTRTSDVVALACLLLRGTPAIGRFPGTCP